LTLLAGCGPKGPDSGPRVPTFPITGTVHVDGKPADNLLVKCHPSGESPVHTTISSYTQPDGKFSVGTYESGDGAPAGQYKLTFMWGQWNLNGRYGPPDKLNDRYSDVEKSTHEVTVQEGEPAELGTIELTTK
jgi:hypothetical protein